MHGTANGSEELMPIGGGLFATRWPAMMLVHMTVDVSSQKVCDPVFGVRLSGS